MKPALLLIVPMAFLVACAGGSSSPQAIAPTAPAQNKDLFDVWTADSNSNLVLTLLGAAYAPGQAGEYQVQSGGLVVCECVLNVTGDQNTGTYTISSCQFNPGGSYSGSDPGCTSYQTTAAYTHSGGILTLGSATYH